MFMSTESAGKLIDHALGTGADFCELFIEKTNNQRLSVKNEEVHSHWRYRFWHRRKINLR